MNNLEKYKKAFTDSLNVSEKEVNDNLKYNEILDYSSYRKGIEILKKYKIEI